MKCSFRVQLSALFWHWISLKIKKPFKDDHYRTFIVLVIISSKLYMFPLLTYYLVYLGTAYPPPKTQWASEGALRVHNILLFCKLAYIMRFFMTVKSKKPKIVFISSEQQQTPLPPATVIDHSHFLSISVHRTTPLYSFYGKMVKKERKWFTIHDNDAERVMMIITQNSKKQWVSANCSWYNYAHHHVFCVIYNKGFFIVSAKKYADFAILLLLLRLVMPHFFYGIWQFLISYSYIITTLISHFRQKNIFIRLIWNCLLTYEVSPLSSLFKFQHTLAKRNEARMQSRQSLILFAQKTLTDAEEWKTL